MKCFKPQAYVTERNRIMEWKGRRQSDNIEDRRGTSVGRGGMGRNPFGRSGIQIPMGSGRRGGGLSIGTIIFLVIIYFVLKMMGIDMLQMLGEGLLNKQIAFELNVSEATIKAHMTAILRKLGASNRTQAVLIAGKLALEPGPLAPQPDEFD